jgi:hypothetical protein
MAGVVRGCARPDVVLKLEGPHAIAELLLLSGRGMALGFDLSFALAVGRLGLFEDVKNVPALSAR